MNKREPIRYTTEKQKDPKRTKVQQRLKESESGQQQYHKRNQMKKTKEERTKKKHTRSHTHSQPEICLWALNVALVMCLFSLAAWFCILYSINYLVLALLCWFSVWIFFFFFFWSLSVAHLVVGDGCFCHFVGKNFAIRTLTDKTKREWATAPAEEQGNDDEEMDRATATTIIITKKWHTISALEDNKTEMDWCCTHSHSSSERTSIETQFLLRIRLSFLIHSLTHFIPFHIIFFWSRMNPS